MPEEKPKAQPKQEVVPAKDQEQDDQNQKAMEDYEDPQVVRKRQEQALMFEKYLEETGLSLSFQIIFTEIIQKQISEDQVFAYTAMRLRQIGKELENIDGGNNVAGAITNK